ncbi:MAG: hypothetical protein AAB589_01560 [Patescibacteria group bacterium]
MFSKVKGRKQFIGKILSKNMEEAENLDEVAGTEEEDDDLEKLSGADDDDDDAEEEATDE